MYLTEGDGWLVSANTHREMLLALYIRDLAGIHPVGMPEISPLNPEVKPSAAYEAERHEPAELRQEWQSWWEAILAGTPDLEDSEEPDFSCFDDSPTLQVLMRAHYGSAMSWAEDRIAEYEALSRRHASIGRRALLERIIDEQIMEMEREPRAFTLNLVELPLTEPRAWFVEPSLVILSQHLIEDPELFRSYLQPVIKFLI
ncbi:hypothetical protein [Paeniglutamicibacter cryotolerans]|uniref:Uncharacterized protein n=1 Tax=Paeniglutamicibacter cryotolerans TaxID=670079 RepID=A0A839QP02_9MICC|nr:hypothetical protein [Paeniglutamicibacter cryotolerans]MBB2996504.1 hypothetical protein [Paeniglutamicibacter cryotolerans]